MERYTTSHCERAAHALAETLGRRPELPVWSQRADGTHCSRVGALMIEPGSATYGRSWKLVEICNEAGGQHTLLSAMTARDLYAGICAMHAGVHMGRETA